MDSYLIITDRNNFKGIIKYIRKKYPLLDFKIYSKEDLKDFYFKKYDGNIINFIMKKYHYHYDFVKELVKYISYISYPSSDKRIQKIYEIKNDLDHNFSSFTYPYLKERLQDKNIIVYGYSSNDFFINKLLKEYHLKATFIENKGALKNTFLNFNSYVDEVMDILNEIARLIEEEHINEEDIYIYCNDDNYLSFIKELAPSFNLIFNGFKGEKLTSLSIFKEMIKDYDECRDLNLVIAHLEALNGDEKINKLIESLKLLDLEGLNYFETKEVIEDSLKSVTFNQAIYKNAINIISSPIFEENKHIFVLNFIRGVYPTLPSSSSYLNDIEKQEISIEDSIDETIQYKDEMLNFLRSKNYFHYSYSNKTNSVDNEPSTLVEELGLKEEKGEIPLTLYSLKCAKFIYASLLDQKRKYDVDSSYISSFKDLDISYFTYDNQFDGITDFTFKKALSYSSTKLFLGCPFSYYCSKVLNLDPFEENFGARLGTFFHAVLEDAVKLKDHFNFDQSYELHLEEAKFDKKENFIAMRYKLNLIEAVDNVIKHLESIPLNEVLTEYDKKIALDDGTLIYGKIDKIIISNHYLYLVDYKTGSGENFSPNLLDYGLSLQLPTYMLIASLDKDLKKYPLGGVYINTVVDQDKIYLDQEERDLTYLKLSGRTLASDEAIKGIDPDYKEFGSKFIAARAFSYNSGYPKERFIDQETFESYKNKAEEFYKEAKKKISNKEFFIKPMLMKGFNACQYCKFKDVCFLKEEQKEYIMIDEKGGDDELE